jgi:hypothetical protein
MEYLSSTSMSADNFILKGSSVNRNMSRFIIGSMWPIYFMENNLFL